MKKNSWFLYIVGLLGALTIDTVISVNSEEPRRLIHSYLSGVFTEDSVYSDTSFSKAVFRTFLALTGSLFVFVLAISVTSIKDCMKYFSFRLMPVVYLIAVFIYLNHHSPNKDEIIYAILSYISLILVIAREHIFFFTQLWFCKSEKSLLLTGLFALTVFILAHPLTLSVGNILGTILIVNLWIYSAAEKNFWMGIAIHAAWNFVLPQSAIFHYAVFVFSCFLAFGCEKYPSAISFEISRSSSKYLRKAAQYWRYFWCAPNRIINYLLSWLYDSNSTTTQEERSQ